MQPRRPRNESDRQLSPRALAAIAEATRRSREAGAGPEPRPSPSTEAPRAHGSVDVPVTVPSPVQAPRAAVATSQLGQSPTVPVLPPEDGPRRVRGNAPVSPGRDPVAPAAPATAPTSGGIRWAGSSPAVEPARMADSPDGLPRRPSPASDSAERRLRWAIGIAIVVLVIMVATLIGTANDGGRQLNGQATTATRPPRAAITGSSGTANSTAALGSTGTTSERAVPSTSTSVSTSTTSSIPTSTSTSTSTSTTLAEASGPPALSALAPASGHAGQRVTVTGSNFLSLLGPDQRTGWWPDDVGGLSRSDHLYRRHPPRPRVHLVRLSDHHHRLGFVESSRLHLQVSLVPGAALTNRRSS